MRPALSTILVATGLALGIAGPAAAESSLDPSASAGGEAKFVSRITDTFVEFAGSPENLQSLVNGLRTGSEITLTGGESTGGADSGGRVATSKGGTTPAATPATTTFTPPTGTLGYGGVYASLALAQAQLASYGIDNPTPQQIAAALNGGAIAGGAGESVTLEGILAMRADGMGWGEIAHAQGTKVGWVVSGLKHAQATAVSPHATSTAGITDAGGGRAAASKGPEGGKAKQGIVDAGSGAAGQSGTAHPGRGIHNALGANAAAGPAYAHGRAKHHGVVTASSASAGSAAAAAAIVSAAGVGSVAAVGATSQTGGAGIVSAGGGNAYGHGAGNGRGFGRGHHHGQRHAYAHGRGKHGR